MAQDDMFVVMYKIIAYLYDCMKRGEEPSNSEWNADALCIPEEYWKKVVKELVEHGLIDGVAVVDTSGGCIVKPYNPKVTMEGVQFAQENSMMAKAAKLLRDAKSSIPFI